MRGIDTGRDGEIIFPDISQHHFGDFILEEKNCGKIKLQKCQIKIVTLATRSPYHRDVLRVTRIPRGNCEISVFEDRTVLFLLCNAKTEARMDEFNIDNECEFLDSLETVLSSTEHNLHGFINDMPQIFAVNNIEHEFYNENAKCDENHMFLDNFAMSSATVSKDNGKEIIELESKCDELRAQVGCLMKEKEAAFEEIKSLKDQILNQSTYCASLGAVLSNLTWHASRFPQIVDGWLLTFQNKIEELLSIVNGSFGAFVDTYKTAFPPTSNVEYQFVKGLLGIVTNISASPEGREFLITNSNGMELVRKIIQLTPELPLAPGLLSLKRLMLMILYNMSINKTGLQCLFESRVGDMLSNCLEDKSSSEEVQLLCLRVLQSVTYDLTEAKCIQDLTGKISIERIEIIASSKRADISDAAKQVIKQLRDCQRITK